MLPSACSLIVDGLTFSCCCSTLHVSAYMARMLKYNNIIQELADSSELMYYCLMINKIGIYRYVIVFNNDCT
jgi:hypothetical protein